MSNRDRVMVFLELDKTKRQLVDAQKECEQLREENDILYKLGEARKQLNTAYRLGSARLADRALKQIEILEEREERLRQTLTLSEENASDARPATE